MRPRGGEDPPHLTPPAHVFAVVTVHASAWRQGYGTQGRGGGYAESMIEVAKGSACKCGEGRRFRRSEGRRSIKSVAVAVAVTMAAVVLSAIAAATAVAMGVRESEERNA